MSAVGLSLRPEASSVREARHYVAQQLSAAGFSAAEPAAALLVSELVTNAVLHARTPFVVSVERRGDVVRVAVADGSARSPRRRRHAIDSGTGRGLMLVERIATRWGVDIGTAGKVVWFELPREPADPAGLEDAWEA